MRRQMALGAALVAAAAISVWGCGEEQGERVVEGCPDAHTALPIAGAVIDEDRQTVKIAYRDSAVPCQFAADRHEGIVYVELRAAHGDVGPRKLESPLSCMQGVSAGTEVSPMSTQDPSNELEDEALQLLEGDCATVARGGQSFVID